MVRRKVIAKVVVYSWVCICALHLYGCQPCGNTLTNEVLKPGIEEWLVKRGRLVLLHKARYFIHWADPVHSSPSDESRDGQVDFPQTYEKWLSLSHPLADLAAELDAQAGDPYIFYIACIQHVDKDAIGHVQTLLKDRGHLSVVITPVEPLASPSSWVLPVHTENSIQ